MESISDRLSTKLLIFVLSVIAGSVDVIGFLGLGALFIAHITGNLVVLAARTAAGEPASVAHLLSVPVFIIVLFAARLLAAVLDRFGIATLRPLLLLQFLLLAGFLAISIEVGSPADPSAAVMIFAAMLGVSAMAVQNVLVQTSLKEAPSTAVMTTNLTRFVADLVEVWFGRDQGGRAKAVARAGRTGIAIAGFVIGACLGAWCQARLGLWSLVVPASLALAALGRIVAATIRAMKSMSAGIIVVFGAAGGAYGPNVADKTKPHHQLRVPQRCYPSRPLCVSTAQRRDAQHRAANIHNEFARPPPACGACRERTAQSRSGPPPEMQSR